MTRATPTLLLAAGVLSACGAPGPRLSVKSAAAPALGTSAATHGLDSERSGLSIRVYRAGPLARLGHNHVILARHLEGRVSIGENPAVLTLEMSIPVADLVVDDSAARSAAGADFAESVDDDARTGTRRNMLGPALLDAGRFPSIAVTALSVGPAVRTGGPMSATLTIDVAGHRSTVETSFTLQSMDGALVASGTAVLRQSGMGLAPFSIMLGALQVQDDIRVDYRLVAPMPAGATAVERRASPAAAQSIAAAAAPTPVG